MRPGPELLDAWRRRSHQKQCELARVLKVTDAYLSQMLSGKRRPSLPIAVRIERTTGVPVASWVDNRRGSAETAHLTRVS